MEAAYGYERKKKMDIILREYLDRNKIVFTKDLTERARTQKENEILLETKHLWKQLGVLIIEMIMIRDALRRHGTRELRYITNNINRIIFSVVKQRRLVDAVALRFRYFEPKDQETEAILELIKYTRERIERLKTKIIPENIELTFLKEYADIIGGMDAFNAEIRTVFYAKKDELFDEKGNGRAPLYDYLDQIYSVVQEHEQIEHYKERLNNYLEIEQKRQNAIKEEKLKEKNEYEHNESSQGLMLFCQMFYKCLRGHQGENERIGIKRGTIVNMLIRHERKGFVILSCKLHPSSGFVYRYYGSNGYAVISLSQAKIFDTLEEANRTAEDLQNRYPASAYTVVDISDEFGNTSCVERVV